MARSLVTNQIVTAPGGSEGRHEKESALLAIATVNAASPSRHEGHALLTDLQRLPLPITASLAEVNHVLSAAFVPDVIHGSRFVGVTSGAPFHRPSSSLQRRTLRSAKTVACHQRRDQGRRKTLRRAIVVGPGG
ncbi:hypothetical protein MKZ38_010040 [Zalerion maritima]|uniref:Uncharacterized protein n=1 Tax=Zalerion maritima TaxID=339359 RepID=A0AAD5RTP1_9PEZI|nr:hypothetical protein MKZ38_010040 [Zalerion maritima]